MLEGFSGTLVLVDELVQWPQLDARSQPEIAAPLLEAPRAAWHDLSRLSDVVVEYLHCQIDGSRTDRARLPRPGSRGHLGFTPEVHPRIRSLRLIRCPAHRQGQSPRD